MMVGLSLLALNLQGLVEYLLTYLLFFWEKQSMRILLQKNLIAHKQRNRLTAFIFSLAIAFVIFAVTGLHMQVTMYRELNKWADATIVLVLKDRRNGRGDFGFHLDPSVI